MYNLLKCSQGSPTFWENQSKNFDILQIIMIMKISRQNSAPKTLYNGICQMRVNAHLSHPDCDLTISSLMYMERFSTFPLDQFLDEEESTKSQFTNIFKFSQTGHGRLPGPMPWSRTSRAPDLFTHGPIYKF